MSRTVPFMSRSRLSVRWCRLLLLPLLLCGHFVPAQAQDTTAATSGNGEYQIGPGDSLNIFVWRQEELSASVPVRPDGMISTPLVEDMVAVGKTPTELAT